MRASVPGRVDEVVCKFLAGSDFQNGLPGLSDVFEKLGRARLHTTAGGFRSGPEPA